MKAIDDFDDKILRELSKDGRISNTELAQAIGLSPSACLRRVQELERSGIIKGYRAIIDRSSIGGGFTVFVTIAISEHQKSALRSFERSIKNAPEVVECFNVAGSFEYLLRVEVSDLKAYKDFHSNFIGTLPLVRNITSYVVMENVKDSLT